MNKFVSLNWFLFLLFPLVIPGCNKQQVEKFKFCLIKSGTKEFLLDEDTPQLSKSVAYYENEAGKYYIHFNMYRSKYLVYDYNTGHLLNKIILDDLLSPSSAMFIDFDSILFVYDSDKNILLISDTTGREVKRVDTKADNLNLQIRSANSKNYAPVLIRANKMFYVNMIMGASLIMPGEFKVLRNSRVAGGFIDLNTGERNNFVFYPDVYFKASYGHINYNTLYSCFSKDAMIVSFPASDYLFRYSLSTFSTDSVKCTSGYFTRIIPLKKERKLASFNEEESLRYFASNPSYSTVCYDQYREVIYRFVELPNKKNAFDPKNTGKSIMKPSAIIILDKDFNKIGETYIGKGYDIMNVVITPEGMLLRKMSNDESNVSYDIFKLKKNE